MKLPDTFQEPKDEELRERVEVSAPGFKFKFDPEDGWQGIVMTVVLVLSIVAGVKLILDYL